MLLWQAHENRLIFFIMYIYRIRDFLIEAKRLAFILALACGWKLFAHFYCFNKELMNASHLSVK